MTLIIIGIAVLLERFFNFSRLRKWNWFYLFLSYVNNQLKGKSEYLILAIAILPLVLVVLLLQIYLTGVLYGFAKFIFQLFILIYCFGPRNLWIDTFNSLDALIRGDFVLAQEIIYKSFGLDETVDKNGMQLNWLNKIFLEFNTRLFSVIFWFVLLGPAAALFYRLVALLNATSDVAFELTGKIKIIKAVLEWLPIRLLAIVFALGGHFVQVARCWNNKDVWFLSNNEAFLTSCGKAAIGFSTPELSDHEYSAEKNALSLIDRSLIIVLVVLACLEFIF